MGVRRTAGRGTFDHGLREFSRMGEGALTPQRGDGRRGGQAAGEEEIRQKIGPSGNVPTVPKLR
jgi:hypothetical protein